ncbi:hypothetical protein GQX74_012712 [Glossina fuscipes]|nr:hypothetical protein GQX74_012712 [Glossina fuscipes]
MWAYLNHFVMSNISYLCKLLSSFVDEIDGYLYYLGGTVGAITIAGIAAASAQRFVTSQNTYLGTVLFGAQLYISTMQVHFSFKMAFKTSYKDISASVSLLRRSGIESFKYISGRSFKRRNPIFNISYEKGLKICYH